MTKISFAAKDFKLRIVLYCIESRSYNKSSKLVSSSRANKANAIRKGRRSAKAGEMSILN